MPREIYSPSLPDAIRDAVRTVEKRARARLLVPAHVEKILAALRDCPAGMAEADGGGVLFASVNQKTTKMSVLWYTHGKKVVEWNVARITAPRRFSSPAPVYKIDTGKFGRRIACSLIFPDRYRRFKHLMCLRQIRRLGVVIPSGTLVAVVDANEALRLAVAHTSEDPRSFLCTPVGFFPIRRSYFLHGAVREILDQAIPSGATWEDIEPLFIMAALGR